MTHIDDLLGSVPDEGRGPDAPTMHAPEWATLLAGCLDRIEDKLDRLLDRETAKDWYSTDEFARLVGRSEYTTREWCRLNRINAQKRRSGRGLHPAWVISHEELERYRREGLLPLRR